MIFLKKPIILLKGRCGLLSIVAAVLLCLAVILIIYTRNDSVAVFADGHGGNAGGLFNIVNGWVD